jgi:hypothetical protein
VPSVACLPCCDSVVVKGTWPEERIGHRSRGLIRIRIDEFQVFVNENECCADAMMSPEKQYKSLLSLALATERQSIEMEPKSVDKVLSVTKLQVNTLEENSERPK